MGHSLHSALQANTTNMDVDLAYQKPKLRESSMRMKSIRNRVYPDMFDSKENPDLNTLAIYSTVNANAKEGQSSSVAEERKVSSKNPSMSSIQIISQRVDQDIDSISPPPIPVKSDANQTNDPILPEHISTVNSIESAIRNAY